LVKIYYFSGTGNTLWSAEKIAEKINGDYELINIGEEAYKNTAQTVLEADAIVILFPAYAYGAPVLVRNFIKRAVIKTSHIGVFVTFGTSPGGALAEIARILKKKNAAVAYYGRIPAVENYIAIFGPQKEKTIQKRLELQRKATDEAISAVTQRLSNRINTFRPLSAFVALLFSMGVKIFYRWYKVTDACNGCGICEKTCPVSAISIQNGKPTFSKKCEHCNGCLNWCPKNAILFGRIKESTPRYHHPEVSLKEISR